MKVTIGISFFNAEDDLPLAIRSVFSQTHQDWELILVDDGSTDRSLEISRSIIDPRVRVISDGRNLRLATRLNQIIELASSDIIVRMDADDLMPPERIEKQLKILEANPDVDLVSTGLVSIDQNGVPFGVRIHSTNTVTREQLLRKTGPGIVHASVIGRRSWFLRNRYDPNVPIAQDYDLWLRSSLRNDLAVYVLQEPLYYVREVSSVTSAKMLLSYRMDRHALWHHRKSMWETRYIIKSFIKTFILKGLILAGRLEWLVRRRSFPLIDKALLEKIYNDISIIRNTNVPGF